MHRRKMTLQGLEQLIPQILVASAFSAIFIYVFHPREKKQSGLKRGIGAPVIHDIKGGIEEPDLTGIPSSVTSVNPKIAVANINHELSNKLSNEERLILEEFLLFAVIWMGFFLLFSTPSMIYTMILNNFILLNFVNYEYFVLIPTFIISGIAVISFVMIRAGTTLKNRIFIIVSIPVVIIVLTSLPAIAPSHIFKHLPLILETYLIIISFVLCGVLFAWYLRPRFSFLISYITSLISYVLFVIILLGKYIFFLTLPLVVYVRY